jgi:hypothetical protein
MADGHAKPIKILIRQLSEDIKIDVVFGKALAVLGHAERCQPLCNRGHRLTSGQSHHIKPNRTLTVKTTPAKACRPGVEDGGRQR